MEDVEPFETRTASMDPAAFGALIEQLRTLGADHLTCEVKKAKGGMPVTVWESISAFANAGGGHLILGVDEKNDFAITGVDDAAAMESQLGALCSEMEPPVRAEIGTITVDDRNVVVCAIPATPRDQRPCHKRTSGPWAGSRIRIADGDRKLTDYEVALLLSNRTEQHQDLTPISGAGYEDLDPELLAAFLRRIRDTRTGLFRRLDDMQALKLLNVLTAHNDRMVPTLAGLLAFGLYPQAFQPQLALTVVAYPTAEAGSLGKFGERFTENRSIDGPIPLMVAECIRVLKRNMRRRSIMSGIFRIDEWEYPEDVVREAIVNALVHRDYSEYARGMQVQVEIYPDRLLVRNAGGLYGPVDVSSLGTTTVTSSRNRALLNILEDTPLGDGHMVCENRGTGIARMLMTLGEAGMEPPKFTDSISTFTVEFPNHTLIDEDAIAWLTSLSAPPLTRSQMTALVMMRNGAVLTNSSYRTSTGVRDSRIATHELRELVDAGIVQQAGTRGSATYQLATSSARPIRHPDGRAAQRGLSMNEMAILSSLADGPKSRADLEVATDLTKAQVNHALRTLRGKGRIDLVGSPRARNARWSATSD